MAIPKHDLAKVKDVPEVKSAMDAFLEAHAASDAAWNAAQEAVVVTHQRRVELEAVATRALEAWRREA